MIYKRKESYLMWTLSFCPYLHCAVHIAHISGQYLLLMLTNDIYSLSDYQRYHYVVCVERLPIDKLI